MEKGESVTLDITGVNSEGEGIARAGDEGFVIFVAGALPGERVRASVVRVAKNYAAAETTEVISASDVRREPRCPDARRCGGCSLQHVSYGAQTAIKAKILTDALRRVAGIELPKKLECIPSPSEWGYRNKTALPVREVGRGRNRLCGYFERRSHRVVPFRGCPVLAPVLQELLPAVIRSVSGTRLRGWNERDLSGDVRYIAARSGAGDDGDDACAIACTVVSRGLAKNEEWQFKGALSSLAERAPSLVGASLNINPDKGNFIWGPAFRDLFGARTIDQRLGRYSFETDISSFFQVNRPQALAMFSKVEALLRQIGASRVLELYAGSGALTAFAASAVERVTAVEEWRPAVRQMGVNMDMNGIANVEIVESSSEDFMSDTDRTPAGAYDTVVLDPPRSGADERVIAGIARVAPRYVIYVSCDPSTLARDISRLAPSGYGLEEITAYDMFPQTPHVEAVALLGRAAC